VERGLGVGLEIKGAPGLTTHGVAAGAGVFGCRRAGFRFAVARPAGLIAWCWRHAPTGVELRLGGFSGAGRGPWIRAETNWLGGRDPGGCGNLTSHLFPEINDAPLIGGSSLEIGIAWRRKACG